MLHDPRWTFRQGAPVLATLFDRYPAIPREHRTSPRRLIEMVALWHRLPVAEVLSHRRYRQVIEARFDAIAAVKDAYPKMSQARLGEIFDRDHTSILNALRQRGRK